MISVDLNNKVALVTGGTKGIGRAAALQLARAGAQVYLTYRWGSADLDELKGEFEKTGAKPPVCIEADVARDEDTEQLLSEIKGRESKLDIFISNVTFALPVPSLKDYNKKSFLRTLEYSAWPIVEYTRKIKEKFAAYPEYVIGISSDGPDHYYPGYDFVAASKALMELFAKYLSIHLLKEGTKVNVLRFGPVATDSFQAFFGESFFDCIREEIPEERVLKVEECGSAVLALCSGMLDALNGQVITVDQGVPFMDNALVKYMRDKTEEKK